MERHLGKTFEDERLRRLINTISRPEELRQVALQLLDMKIAQEAAFYKIMFHWKQVSPEEVEKAVSNSRLKKPNPPIDPYDYLG